MSNASRNRGHGFERETVLRLKEMGYDAVTSRYESKRMDDAGIDIVSNFPFKIQCKATCNTPNPHSLITDTEAEVIFFRKMEKRKSKFYAVGEYAMIKLEDFYSLIKNHEGIIS